MMLIAAASRPEAKRLLPGKTGPADAGHTLFHGGRRGPSGRKQQCTHPSIPGGRIRQTGTAAAETSPTRKPQPHRGNNRRSPQSRRLLRHGRSRPATPGTRRYRKRTKPARTIQPNIPARRRESAVVSTTPLTSDPGIIFPLQRPYRSSAEHRLQPACRSAAALNGKR